MMLDVTFITMFTVKLMFFKRFCVSYLQWMSLSFRCGTTPYLKRSSSGVPVGESSLNCFPPKKPCTPRGPCNSMAADKTRQLLQQV